MTELADLPLWPDTVDAFYVDHACSIRSAATRKTWGYTYRTLQRLHPNKPVGAFTTDDLVAFVTQQNWGGPRWASATARNYRVAMQSLFGISSCSSKAPRSACMAFRERGCTTPADVRPALRVSERRCRVRMDESVSV